MFVDSTAAIDRVSDVEVFLKVRLQYSVQQRRAEEREVISIVKAKGSCWSRRLLHLMLYA